MNTKVTSDWWLDMSEIEFFAWYEDIFTKEELDKIEKLVSDDDLSDGKIDGDLLDASIRDSKIKFIDSSVQENRWVFERFTGIVNNANERFFKFDLSRLESLQYTVYNEGQYYKDHMDMSYRNPNNAVRKLSFTMQLSEPDDYDGGDLVIKHGSTPDIARKNRGAITFFPSYIMHEVTPVTRGVRKSIVGWVTGPRWK
jgi:PKHD-type hydroxylase